MNGSSSSNVEEQNSQKSLSYHLQVDQDAPGKDDDKTGGSSVCGDLIVQATWLDDDTVTITVSPSGEDQIPSSVDPPNKDESIVVDPWSAPYIGIPLSYLTVGILLGSSRSVLYPILVVQQNASPALVEASASLVTIFWSYKLFFGFLTDCFPIGGYKRRPYILVGWILTAIVMGRLGVITGKNITSQGLVLTLTAANFGYMMADVASDGFVVSTAHREPLERRGSMQTLSYASNKLGQVAITAVMLFGFSGPLTNCPGYEPNPDVACSEEEDITSRAEYYEDFPDEWCHMKCSAATFDFDLSVSGLALLITSLIVLSLPFYCLLRDDKSVAQSISSFVSTFWSQLQHRAAWQLVLYHMVSSATFSVSNPAKSPANKLWLGLTTAQYQLMIILEKISLFGGLVLIRRYALDFSWRKMVLIGSGFCTIFNCLYFIIVFDVWRNPWFYVFTDVSSEFAHTLNWIATLLATAEVAQPGYEAVTYALVTSAGNSLRPLSSVVSNQFISFFPLLTSQSSLENDTNEVRFQFASLHLLVILVNLSSLLPLPMLPRQKVECHEIVANGGISKIWGKFAVISAATFLAYSTAVTFVTVTASDSRSCLKVLGGKGCSDDESGALALVLAVGTLCYCYGVTYWHAYRPLWSVGGVIRRGMFV